MKKLPFMLIACAAAWLSQTAARAVYAPIPEVEQGRLFTLYLSAGCYYDTNIFGAAAGETESMVFQVQPSLMVNVSSGDQTFLTASYRPSLDCFDNRPGDKFLLSHSLSARIAHTFTTRLEGEISDTFQIVKNPESLLPGIGGGVANPDQSYDYNQLDGKLTYGLNKRSALKGKLRALDFSYDNKYLSIELDHGEYLAGIEFVRSARENLQVVAEYRWQAIRYDHGGADKDKDSHALFAGADYAMSKKTGFSARLGAEALLRKNGDDALLPYVELGAKHDYRDSSYVSAGYRFSAQETSNLAAYTDMYAHYFFLNWQHAFSKTWMLSGLADWQPSRLNGRKHVAPDINEDNIKLGGALTYAPGSRWSFSLTCDYDLVNSDDSARELRRLRTGVQGRCLF